MQRAVERRRSAPAFLRLALEERREEGERALAVARVHGLLRGGERAAGRQRARSGLAGGGPTGGGCEYQACGADQGEKSAGNHLPNLSDRAGDANAGRH